MTLHNPTHPGEHLLLDYFEPLGMTIAEGAEVLGISHETLAEICECRGRVTPEIAVRLHKAFGGPSVQSWVLLQAYYDIAEAERNAHQIEVERYEWEGRLAALA